MFLKWDQIPKLKDTFLKNLVEFEKYGGQYVELEGLEREIEIRKNDALLEKNLPYELEKNPTSPHLVLKQVSTVFAGPIGVILLLFFLGTTLIREKEQKTLLALKTQPISQKGLYGAKLMSIFVFSGVYLILVFLVGIFLPWLIGDHSLRLDYPQVVFKGDEVVAVSTLTYVLRVFALFMCGLIFAYSLVMFVSLRMKNTFNTLLLTFLILAGGFGLTNLVPMLEHPLNPFYLLMVNENLSAQAPGLKDGLYLLVSLGYSFLFYFLSRILPEKELSILDFSHTRRPFRGGKAGGRKSVLTSLMVFEGRKEIRKGNYRLVLAILIPLLIFSYFNILEEAREKKEGYLRELARTDFSSKIEEYEEVIRTYRSYMENSDDGMLSFYAYEIGELNEKINFLRDWEEKAKTAVQEYREGNYRTLIEYQLFENEVNRGDYEKVSGIDNLKYYGGYNIDVSIAEKKWMIEHDVEPIFSGAYHITMIRSDQFNDSPYSQIEVERNRKVDGSALYSLYLLFQEHAYFLPLLFLVFMLGTGLAGERGKQPTIRFLRTQPISDRAILFGKFVHSALWSILLTILLVGIVVLLGTIFDRFGDWNYPVLHHDGVTEINLEDYKGTFSYHYGYQLLPLGKALLQTISLLILVILFVLAFTQFLSLLFRNTFVVYVVSGLVFICGYVLATKFFPHISQWTPFPYLNVSQVVNGELSTMLDQPYLDFYGGIRVILAAIVATMVLSFVAARRRV